MMKSMPFCPSADAGRVCPRGASAKTTPPLPPTWGWTKWSYTSVLNVSNHRAPRKAEPVVQEGRLVQAGDDHDVAARALEPALKGDHTIVVLDRFAAQGRMGAP